MFFSTFVRYAKTAFCFNIQTLDNEIKTRSMTQRFRRMIVYEKSYWASRKGQESVVRDSTATQYHQQEVGTSGHGACPPVSSNTFLL
jgi:hypothetical protein